MDIKINDGKFLVKGKPFFLYSGEIHYFRIPKNLWRTHLLKAKKAGLNTVSSYIPWCIHEKEENKFNFKDLISFIQLVKESGLFFIARVGPVSNAELVFEGLPEWLLEKYPDVCIKTKDLVSDANLISYHNPVFLSHVEKWYDKILPLVSSFQVTKGSCIIFVQLCNEIGMVHWLNKAIDYSKQTERMYRKFLRNKYNRITNLNKVYKTRYADFNKVRQINNRIDSQTNILPYIDWMYFYCDYYAQYYKLLYTMAKKNGITVPVIANFPQFYDFDVRGRGVYSPMTTIMFRDFAGYVPEVIFGGAYQMRRLDYENFHDVLLTTEVVKMISLPDRASICCELQFGIMRDRPKIYPQDVELNLKISTASGLNGFNGYMFSGGKNPSGLGGMGSYHEWQSPVSSQAKERPHFKSVELFGKIVKTFGTKIAQTRKQTDIAIGFYAPYYATELLKGEFIEELEETRTLLFFDGMARLLTLAGISYSFIDLERASSDELKKINSLWVFSLEFMDRETQQKLFEYVESGGNMVLYPKIPTKNLMFQKEDLLSKKFDIRIQKEVKENLVYIDGMETLTHKETQIFDVSDKKEIVGITKNNEACAVLRKYDKGKILAIGFGLNHIFDYQIAIVEHLAQKIGLKKSVAVMPDSEVQAILRSNDRFGFLFVSNYHQIQKSTWIKLMLPGEKKITRIPSNGLLNLPPRTSYVLPLNVPVYHGISIRYSTVEIINHRKIGKNVELILRNGLPHKNAEIELLSLHRPKQIRLNNKKIPFQYSDMLLKIKFSSNGQQKFVIMY